MTKKPGIILQARLTSKRFPNKMLYPVNNKPIIQHTLDRLKGLPWDIVVAIPGKYSNQPLAWYLENKGYEVFMIDHNEEDVTWRFVKCAEKYNFDPIIRICGDSVLISKDEIVDTMEKYNVWGNNWLAVGNGVQIFSYKALKWVNDNIVRMEEREHVWTPMELTINYPEDVDRYESQIKKTR